MNYKEALLEAGKKMFHSGLTVETWGNISLRDPGTGLVYLTPSAMPYDSLTENDVVVMRPDGSIAEGKRKPTVEAGLHLGVYRVRPEINAVLHTHPVQSMVFSVLRRPIPPVTDEAAQIFGDTVNVAEYALPGTPELAANARTALGKNGMACLLANHGAVCLGKDIGSAFRACTVLEMTAEVYRMALTVGTPAVLSDGNVAYMKDFMDHRYGQEK